MTPSPIQRRAALEQLGLAIAAASLASNPVETLQANETVSQQSAPRHLLSSALFGYSNLSDILPIAKRLGIQAIDVWPKVHGNQHEQLTEMGEVFMHPFPRGVPIAEGLDQVSELLAASKAYVDQTWNSASTN